MTKLLLLAVGITWTATIPYCSGIIVGPIEGRVRDDLSKHPIPDAEVHIEVSTYLFSLDGERLRPLIDLHATTDEDGKFVTAWWFGGYRGYRFSLRKVQVRPSKSGYVTPGTRPLYGGWESRGRYDVWLTHNPKTRREAQYEQRQEEIRAVIELPTPSYRTGGDFSQAEYEEYVVQRGVLDRKAHLMRFLWQSLQYDYTKGAAATPAEVRYAQAGCARIRSMYRALESENQAKAIEFRSGRFEGHDVTHLAVGVKTAFEDCIN